MTDQTILTGHQPTYLPWLGLFHKIALADKFIFLDTVQYLKKDWNNRNKINSPNGPIWLTIPVLTKDKFYQNLNEVKINNQIDWRKKHWEGIKQVYRKTPYFADHAPFFEKIYSQEWTYLSDLNREIIKYFLKVFNITTEWIEARDLNLQGHKTELIIDMCQKTDSQIFVFGKLGLDYAEPDKFQQKNISILFQDYQHPTYPQQFNKFESHLSALDLLFNCGPDSFQKLMENNLTKEDILKKLK